LFGKELLKLGFDTIRKAFETGNRACPGSTKGGALESYQRRLNSSGLMRRNQQFQKLAAISLEVIKRRWYHTPVRRVNTAVSFSSSKSD
jgi:hypothetical protein